MWRYRQLKSPLAEYECTIDMPTVTAGDHCYLLTVG
jgi:hypothetical protein